MRAKKKYMERQFTLPHLTSVSLPPSKENHTVSYAKGVLGGGALHSAVRENPITSVSMNTMYVH